MSRLATLLIAMLMMASSMLAANSTQTVTTVSTAIDLTTDVDYTITSSSAPFGAMGSVNIANTDHAVLILSNIKPSVVLSKYMSFIYIDGQKAENGVNCQVKMYGTGAIVFPYGSDFRPLTVYSEPGFKGESCDDFGLENTGGFMNTLTTAKLNNRIRSFRLKRGYMVTFALGTGGWGYSRCFIADRADLEFSNMPANMDAKISSYRVFHWYNAQKKGLASNAGKAANDALNTSWCYDWAQGNASLLPDHEWVPNHIYEDWPSAATCGSVTGSCHMKTNNEPGNSADDHPQDVATVLANWQNLMRTGMRLCSETSHDGSWNHLRAFIDSIDARGWRCDILDLHCYWSTGFGNLTGYSDDYGKGRPIWISEWIWGASWNGNGAFASGVTDTQIYNRTVEILNALNSNTRVERYAYWNGESKGHIYENGSTTTLGKYYASMNSGLGYNAANEYIPRIVYTSPTNLDVASYNKTTGIARLTWADNNGDMIDSLVVEYLAPGTTRYRAVATVAPRDKTGNAANTYAANVSLDVVSGAHTFRIAAYPAANRVPRYSGTASVTTSMAQGNDLLQYGVIEVANTDAISTDFQTPFTAAPVVLMGIQTNKNANTTTVSLISSISVRGFTYQPLPWAQSGTQTYSGKEQIPFLAISQGSHKQGSMQIEVGQEKVKTDTTQVTFATPFPEGVTPVVIVEVNKPSLKENPINLRIWDVTNTGFKAIALYEAGVGKGVVVKQTMSYMAVTPGQATLDGGITLSAGIGTTPLYGTTYRPVPFRKTQTDGSVDDTADSLALLNPYIFGAAQTFNIKAAIALRHSVDMTVTDPEWGTLTYGARIRRMVDMSGDNATLRNTSATADTVGWICISTTTQTTAIPDVNNDGQVDTADVLALYEQMQQAEPDMTFDVNQDGIIDTQDVLIIYEYMQNN